MSCGIDVPFHCLLLWDANFCESISVGVPRVGGVGVVEEVRAVAIYCVNYARVAAHEYPSLHHRHGLCAWVQWSSI